MNKKVFIVMFIATFMLVTVACGGDSSAPTTEQTQQQTAKNANEGTSIEQQNATGGETPKTANSLKLTMAGGSAGGFWSMLGEGVGNVLRQSIPNTQFSYETGNGVKNILSVNSGEIPLGIAFNFEVKTALKGEEPFKEKVSEVTALATLYNASPLQTIISKEFADKYGIKSYEDIAEKKPPIRIAVNQRGNLLEKVNRLVFESYGITYEDIKSWGGEVYYEAYKPGAQMMKDKKNEWVGAAAFPPDGVYLELATSTPIQFLPLNEKAQSTLLEEMGMISGVLKAGTYEFQTEDIPTVNAGAMIIADPNMSSEEAYTITKAMVENIEKIQALHKNIQNLNPEIMADVAPAKLHPGAERYFKEKGYIK